MTDEPYVPGPRNGSHTSGEMTPRFNVRAPGQQHRPTVVAPQQRPSVWQQTSSATPGELHTQNTQETPAQGVPVSSHEPDPPRSQHPPMPTAVTAVVTPPAWPHSGLQPMQPPLTPILPLAEEERSSLPQAARALCLVLALLWFVVGGVAVARASMAGIVPVTVAGIGLNAASGGCAIGVAVLLALVSAPGRPNRGAVTLMSMLMLGPGLVVAIVPQAFSNAFGATAGTGVALALSGVLLGGIAHVPDEWGSQQ